MIEVETGSFDDQARRLAGALPPGRGPELAVALDGARPEAEPRRAVLVPSGDLVPVAELALLVEREGEPVVLGHLEPEELAGFLPIESVEIPEGPAYLAVDVDLGAGSRNLRPEDALREILAAGRSPLTLEEGIALMLQQPGAIVPNWGFSMAGSRRGDQRVPAFWVSEGRPKLGWCWDRNPHTWLGTASCAARVGGGAGISTST